MAARHGEGEMLIGPKQTGVIAFVELIEVTLRLLARGQATNLCADLVRVSHTSSLV